ncbi:MAG: arginine--tRNA ligase [Bacteroidaceae bacterium]|nr:arginine--tRNA ligase [Prevotellaceae bacterium]MDY5632671.1 arginine--tRNA ligase [Bacteroidaceae bacterium]
MKISQKIAEAAKEALQEMYGQEVAEKMIQLQETRPEFEGNLTLVVFPFLKMSKKSPEATAQDLGEKLVEKIGDVVLKFNVVKGFLNLVINPAQWIMQLQEVMMNERFGFTPVTEQSPLVMIEYSSPNTNKPLHLGHVRNNLLGWALANVMEANGNKVVKTNIVNDRGIHICKSMLAWLKYGNGETPETSGKKGDHLIGDYYVAFDKHYRQEVRDLVSQGMDEEQAKQEAPLIKEAHEMLVKWEQNDPEVRALWRKMNEWVYAGFDKTYKALGVSFDKIYYESDTYLEGKEKVMEGLEKGFFYRREDGSVWADLTQEGLDEKLLLRSDGTSVYMTQDIGTAKLRFRDYPIDKMIYVVGNEQNYHFQVLSILLDKLGFKWGKDLVHFSYGMVELPNGKMKSREGTVVDADDLITTMIKDAREMSADKVNKLEGITADEADEIARIVGLGALKYFILKVDARKNMLFNPEESIDFNGNTGPFIQYTYARIRSILRKAEAMGMAVPTELPTTAALSDKEISLIQHLNDFPAAVRQAGTDYNPSCIANYCYELVKEYNQFYHDFSVLREENEAKRTVRLALSKAVSQVVKNALGLLGIEVPERM